MYHNEPDMPKLSSGEIPELLRQVQENVMKLHSVVQELGKRLAPVSVRRDPAGKPAIEGPRDTRPTPSSPIGIELEKLVDKTREIGGDVAELIGELRI